MTQLIIEAVDHTGTDTFITTNTGVVRFPLLAITPPVGSSITFSLAGFEARFLVEDTPGNAYVVEVLYEPSSTAAYLLSGGMPLACLGEATNRYGVTHWGNGAKWALETLRKHLTIPGGPP